MGEIAIDVPLAFVDIDGNLYNLVAGGECLFWPPKNGHAFRGKPMWIFYHDVYSQIHSGNGGMYTHTLCETSHEIEWEFNDENLAMIKEGLNGWALYQKLL